MSIGRKLKNAASGSADGGGGSAGGTYVDDVFSTYVYEGNSFRKTISNGIDLDGEGGLVWIKARSAGKDHALFDTERGGPTNPPRLRSNNTDGNIADPDGLNSFNSDGFTVGSSSTLNKSGDDVVSWTFRKAPKFFDVVTYTGDSVAGREIPHNLGVKPGMVIIKNTTSSTSWPVYHASAWPASGFLQENKEFQSSVSTGWFNDTEPTESTFTVGDVKDANLNNEEYVAYVFAHDDSDESIIKCGSYTGNGNANGHEIDLGFEPQFLIVKRSDQAYEWGMFDNMRGLGTKADPLLQPSNADAEGFPASYFSINANGFSPATPSEQVNANNGEYIYMAIRRPNKPAEEFDPEELFAMFRSNNPGNMGGLPGFRSGFPVDMAFWTTPDGGGTYKYIGDRPNQGSHLYTHGTDAALTSGSIPDNFKFDYNNGYYSDGNAQWFSWMWRRAPGFFDVVTHTCDGNRDSLYPHSLGVVPDMVWRKELNNDANWQVWVRDMPNGNDGADGGVYLNDPGQYYTTNTQWAFKVPPTDTHLSNGVFRTAGREIVSYLFASAPGISKVGIYSGTGAEIDVDCGFTTGARFVLIKRADATGDWYFWDTERGITAGNDPYLLLNDTAAQVTNTDYIDPLSSGFKVTANANAAINASDGEYIFYAIA